MRLVYIFIFRYGRTNTQLVCTAVTNVGMRVKRRKSKGWMERKDNPKVWSHKRISLKCRIYSSLFYNEIFEAYTSVENSITCDHQLYFISVDFCHIYFLRKWNILVLLTFHFWFFSWSHPHLPF